MSIPSNINRFKIIKELGKGSQGVVYLAEDPHLERQVAIKLQKKNPLVRNNHHFMLIQEARTISKLQHPNIVPVYEAGEYDGRHYIVLEYVEGISLGILIKKKGAIDARESARLVSKILEGIAYIHEKGVIHGDLTPSNIQIDKNGVPRIMDFGISGMISLEKGVNRFPGGTPLYMSPEHFLQTPPVPQSDIFSLGLVFYEMLTGHPAFRAGNKSTMMRKIINTPVERPSLKNKTIDQELDRIILKALEKKQELRYTNALDMKKELDTYLDQDKKGGDIADTLQTDNRSTINFLLRRISHNKDFPTFSKYMIEINQKLSSKEKYLSASDVANSILKDYALTNKLLRLVNSAFYGISAGKITTVTRAVVVLGFEQVRLAAASLALFEHLQSKNQMEDLKNAAINSFTSGLLARNLAEKVSVGPEEAFICSMLYNLGNHLVIFYLPEEYKEIKKRMTQRGENEHTASHAVLGVSYNELGVAIASAWKLPDKIIHSMHRLPKGEAKSVKSEDDLLRGISNFSNELCDIISETDGDAREDAFSSLMVRFKKIVPLSQKELYKLFDTVKEDIDKYSDSVNVDLKGSDLIRRLTINIESRKGGTDSEETETHINSLDQKTQIFDSEPFPDSESHETIIDDESLHEMNGIGSTYASNESPLELLTNGIQEINNVLVENYDLNDVIIMILETMYRGFTFDRVIFCMMDATRKAMHARFGLGKAVDSSSKTFWFHVKESSDVFNLAISQGKDLRIKDSTASKIKPLIPEWYRKTINAPAFIIYPIFFNKICLGLFYGDKDEKGPPIPENLQNYMKILRSQMLLAIKKGR
ncbi:MAG: HDOD domain-containing protein [Thermodesulfobacteriota bacterium]|nr:HDOD domain-containing protein [Thermodesulfobacteriota bacterium]